MHRTLEQLIDPAEPAWPQVQSWLAEATNPVELLPATRLRGRAALLRLQVTSRSPLGAVALSCGGLLFDGGWLRFLGAGCRRLRGSLVSWNFGPRGQPRHPGLLLVAHDAAGGFFALDGGALGGQPGDAFYRAPDSLQWEPTGLGYSALLQWAARGDLAGFYRDLRWTSWQRAVAQLPCDRGIHFYPPLWAREGSPESSRRRAVPMAELWALSA